MAIRLTGLARCGIAATLVIDDQVQTVAKNNPGATVLLAGLALMGLAAGSTFGAGEAVLRIEMDKQRPHVVFLSWDTEDGSRAATNLLRTGTAMRLRLRSEGQGKPGDDLTLGSVDSKSNAMMYRLTPAPKIELLWSLNPTTLSLSTTLSRQGTSSEPIAGVELLIPFDPRVTPTTVLPMEFIAEFLARRDVDNDGFVEAVQSGNRGTLKQPARSCAWFDALNCGHKDGYTNALIYRAWRCLADLEAQLGRGDKQARYGSLADRLKASYAKTLYNPATGWLAWWKSEDGELHDYATPVVNGLAIEYGLVEPAQGREILARLWAKMDQVGFTRVDLGVPPMLVPVRRSDYLLPDGLGIPQREDGTDTLGHYQNGGITAGQVLHFLAAHYVVGQPERADRVLRAMLERQTQGKFQNGVRDAGGQGIDWTDWNGNATGYEGYLADSYRFLQAVLLREPALRARYYRPLMQTAR